MFLSSSVSLFVFIFRTNHSGIIDMKTHMWKETKEDIKRKI